MILTSVSLVIIILTRREKMNKIIPMSYNLLKKHQNIPKPNAGKDQPCLTTCTIPDEFV